MTPLIHARQLVKRFGDLSAVDGIDFDVNAGECFGFLGPNGAGKTTTMRLLYAFSPITSGTLTIAGLDVTTQARAIKAMIGVVPQENNLDPDLTVLQNLLVYARYFGIAATVARTRAVEALELFQLTEKANARIDQLSGGMKRRLIVARALINEPRLILLDEPTTGLDPQARHLVWQKLRYLKANGATLVLTTHYMEEATQLCDRLVIMDHGKILAEGAPLELVENFVGRAVIEIRGDEAQKERAHNRLRGRDVVVEDSGDTLYIFSRDHADLQAELDGLKAERVVQRNATLEDVFLKLTGHVLQE